MISFLLKGKTEWCGGGEKKKWFSFLLATKTDKTKKLSTKSHVLEKKQKQNWEDTTTTETSIASFQSNDKKGKDSLESQPH